MLAGVGSGKVSRGTTAVYRTGGWEIDLLRREVRSHGVAVPMGGRAFEILEVLVRSFGELVSKNDLMKQVWPGAIVEENTLQFHISAVRKALGADRGLLKTVFGRGYRLLGAWSIHPGDAPADPADPEAALPAGRMVPTNVPVALSGLIGRARARQHLQDVLSAYRVVTLTGPGGIGKSVLGLEVARSLLPAFEGACWLVELASLSDPGLVPSAVAGALGLRVGGDEMSAAAVARAIGARQILLVLDNCEHLVQPAAEFAETLMRMCPHASVIATSRENLRIEGEYVYRVAPLDVPPEGSADPGNLHDYSAVQLFVARMTALGADGPSQPTGLSTIAAICRRLDGIPLAIEFAASRASVLGLQLVADRLHDRFRLLGAGRRTAIPRHQTLRATLDWSHNLLPESERRLLRRLANFVGGFTLDAAVAVMSDVNGTPSTVVEGIASLVGKSLVALDRSTPSGRWRLLETIRAYANEKLVRAGEAQQAARRHAGFYLDLLPSIGSDPEVPPTIEDFSRYGREIDNVRVALDWAFSAAGDAGIGVALTAAYTPVWMHFVLIAECRARIERALESMEADPTWSAPVRMRLLIALGIALIITMGSIERSRTVLTAGLALAESLDEADAQLRALWALWALDFNRGDCRAAQSAAERFSRVARRCGDAAALPVAERIVGYTLHRAGSQREARQHLERALALYVAPKEHRRRGFFLYDQHVLTQAMLARPLLLLGFADQARSVAEASLAEAQKNDDRLVVCFILMHAVCPVALLTGDLAAAERAVSMLNEAATRHSFSQFAAGGRCLEATLRIARNEFEAGTKLLISTLESAEKIGWRIGSPGFLGAAAVGTAGLGQVAKALSIVDQALAQADRGGECAYTAELLRCKGELLLQVAGPASVPMAEQCFEHALDVAREQGAVFWELRVAMSLARLRAGQNREDESHRLLAAVLERFTEGFDTADLCAAKAILEARFCHGSCHSV